MNRRAVPGRPGATRVPAGNGSWKQCHFNPFFGMPCAAGLSRRHIIVRNVRRRLTKTDLALDHCSGRIGRSDPAPDRCPRGIGGTDPGWDQCRGTFARCDPGRDRVWQDFGGCDPAPDRVRQHFWRGDLEPDWSGGRFGRSHPAANEVSGRKRWRVTFCFQPGNPLSYRPHR